MFTMRERGYLFNVAVIDAGGSLVAHIRMDGAWISPSKGVYRTCLRHQCRRPGNLTLQEQKMERRLVVSAFGAII
jgi:hypothetical protein